MYKGASAFNKEVSIEDVTSDLTCTSMFENALSLNSPVSIAGGSPSQTITLDSMFRNAVVFNKNVIFAHKISSANQMFQGATAYGNDDIVSGTATLKPKLGVSDAYNISADSAAKLEYMFDGTRFDDTVTGTAPADCSYMFAGASYFNTQLGSFMTSATTNLTGMFKDATSLEVSPFPDTAFLSNVTNLTSTFEGATQFNADIRAWGSVLTDVNYTRTFHSATSFNQDIPGQLTGVSSWPTNDKADTFTNASAYTFYKKWTKVDGEAPTPIT